MVLPIDIFYSWVKMVSSKMFFIKPPCNYLNLGKGMDTGTFCCFLFKIKSLLLKVLHIFPPPHWALILLFSSQSTELSLLSVCEWWEERAFAIDVAWLRLHLCSHLLLGHYKGRLSFVERFPASKWMTANWNGLMTRNDPSFNPWEFNPDRCQESKGTLPDS